MSWFDEIYELEKVDPEVAEIIKKELERQRNTINLIASENYTSVAVMQAQASVLTNKYAEGYPGKRYYAGCKYYDIIEEIARERAKKLFNAEYANVQAHSGAQANMAVYFAVLKPGDKILSMELAHGSHLTHGAKVNFSGQLYNVVFYHVDKETEQIDYAEVEELARKEKPKLIICGYSAYPREIDFKTFGEIAEEVNAHLMADIAHIAGLVAAGVHPSPVEYADFVTSTTQKTLRGPRGGLILCKAEHAKIIDKAVFPGIQGGPFMHTIAAKAVCFKEAMTNEFKEYAKQIVKNAKAMAKKFEELGYRLVAGGTDNHLMLIDLRPKGVTGKQAQDALEECNIVLNRNMIPYDPQPPYVTSGIRIGTPAITTRGMKEKEAKKIAELIDMVIENIKRKDEEIKEEVKQEVEELCEKFPIYE